MSWNKFGKLEISIGDKGNNNFVNGTKIDDLNDVDQLLEFQNVRDSRYVIFIVGEVFKADKKLELRFCATLLLLAEVYAFTRAKKPNRGSDIATQFCSLFSLILKREKSEFIRAYTKEMMLKIHEKYPTIAFLEFMPQ